MKSLNFVHLKNWSSAINCHNCHMLSLKQQPLVKPHLQDFKSEACLIFVRDTDKLQEKVQQTIPTGRKKKKKDTRTGQFSLTEWPLELNGNNVILLTVKKEKKNYR